MVSSAPSRSDGARQSNHEGVSAEISVGVRWSGLRRCHAVRLALAVWRVCSGGDSMAGLVMRILAAVAVAVMLAGCQSTPTAGETPLDGEPRVTTASGGETTPEGLATFDPPAGPLSPEEIWRVEPQDTVAHIQSGA